jgi:hypothetical protein
MVDENGHFLQVATRSTRKAWRVNRIKPPGTAGRNPQMRFAVRAGTLARRSGRSATPGVTLAGPVVTPLCCCALALGCSVKTVFPNYQFANVVADGACPVMLHVA